MGRALKEDHMPSDASNRRALLRQLEVIMSMIEGTDPDIFITDVWGLTHTIEDFGEPVLKANIKDVIVAGLAKLYV